LRRNPAVILLIAIVAVGVAAVPSRPREFASESGASRRGTHTILVNLTCGNDTDDWVNDSSVRAIRGDTIVWQLTPESSVEDFKVKRKRLMGRWLFERSEVPGAPGNPARGNDMKSDAEGRYTYEIKGRCRGPEKAEIDPDIIIDLS
jgi:hypothetical protein